MWQSSLANRLFLAGYESLRRTLCRYAQEYAPSKRRLLPRLNSARIFAFTRALYPHSPRQRYDVQGKDYQHYNPILLSLVR